MAKVFIAGPVNKTSFTNSVKAVSLKLKEMHLEAANAGDMQREKPNREYINHKLRLLMDSDMICMLPGSDESNTASFFRAYAGAVKMPILRAYTANGEWYIV